MSSNERAVCLKMLDIICTALLGFVQVLFNSTLSEHLSLFVKLLFAIGGIESGLTVSVVDLHLAEDLRQGGIPPG